MIREFIFRFRSNPALAAGAFSFPVQIILGSVGRSVRTSFSFKQIEAWFSVVDVTSTRYDFLAGATLDFYMNTASQYYLRDVLVAGEISSAPAGVDQSFGFNDPNGALRFATSDRGYMKVEFARGINVANPQDVSPFTFDFNIFTNTVIGAGGARWWVTMKLLIEVENEEEVDLAVQFKTK